jgi:methyltransferase
MPTAQEIAFIVLGLVALQRLIELPYARRNAQKLLARGGREYGEGHYPLFVILHAAWLVSMAVFLPPALSIHWGAFLAYVLLQGFRIWVIATLGPYWTTRIITVPGAPLIRRGPYRYLRHPNYLLVVGEIALLPLVFGEVEIAIVFSILNFALLFWRIRIEDRALQPRRTQAP